MGGSSLERVFFWKKKKKSPLSNAFNQMKKSLPKKRKSKKKSILKKLQLENLKKDKKSPKKFFLTPNKKASKSQKTVSVGKDRKGSDPNTPEGKKEKDREGLVRVGEKIKKKFSPENKKELATEPEVAPLKENHEGKTSLQKLKDIMKPRRPSETKAN